MFTLKPISRSGIKAALERAERYRLLNEPRLAESICLDILEVESENQEAIVMLLLSLTDQFDSSNSSTLFKQAKALLPRISNEYEKVYYAGLICERMGKSVIDKKIPDYKHTSYEWIRDAMDHYEAAESLRPADDDSVLLRWNTCVRIISRYNLEPRREDRTPQFLE